MGYTFNPFTGKLDNKGSSTTGSIISALEANDETPTPATDGAQTEFTVANSYVSGTLKVYLDGLKQIKGTDFTETSATKFTMTVAPASSETICVDYIKA